MSMMRLTRLPVRVVSLGISGSVAFTGGTACWAMAVIVVSMSEATAASKRAFFIMGPSEWIIVCPDGLSRPNRTASSAARNTAAGEHAPREQEQRGGDDGGAHRGPILEQGELAEHEEAGGEAGIEGEGAPRGQPRAVCW